MITYVTNDSGNVRKCYWTQGLKHWTRTNNIQINMVEFHIITLGEEIGTSIKAVERAFQVFNDRFKAWLIGLFMSWNFLIAQKSSRSMLPLTPLGTELPTSDIVQNTYLYLYLPTTEHYLDTFL